METFDMNCKMVCDNKNSIPNEATVTNSTDGCLPPFVKREGGCVWTTPSEQVSMVPGAIAREMLTSYQSSLVDGQGGRDECPATNPMRTNIFGKDMCITKLSSCPPGYNNEYGTCAKKCPDGYKQDVVESNGQRYPLCGPSGVGGPLVIGTVTPEYPRDTSVTVTGPPLAPPPTLVTSSETRTMTPAPITPTPVAPAPKPVIYGIGLDSKIYSRQTLDSPWQLTGDGTCCVKDVFVMNDGKFLGIGKDNSLYTRDSLGSAPWIGPISQSCCVHSVVQMKNGKILAVGMDNILYTRDTLTSSWVPVPNSCCVKGVYEMPNNKIMGIGMDGTLFTKDTLTSPWVQVPNSGTVIDVKVLSDGTIIGVGTGNVLWKRQLNTNWVLIPNSGTVTNID
jgi:hypothetical protein